MGPPETVPDPLPDRFTARCLVWSVNVAVTACVTSIVKVQGSVEQSPPHEVKSDPASGVAVRVTTSVVWKSKLQVGGQLMPIGLLVTVPLPLPAGVTTIVLVLAARAHTPLETITQTSGKNAITAIVRCARADRGGRAEMELPPCEIR
jgi:hypothetical protein